MRFGKLSFTASAILFMGVATVLVGSALKLAHMGLGGIPLWNTADALQQIGIVAVSAIFLLNVKTLMGTTEAKPVERYVPPRKPAMNFAEMPRTDPKPDSARHSHLSPLDIALEKLDRQPNEVAHTNRRPSQQKDEVGQDGTPGEELPFLSDQAAHDRGALQTASEHCFAGSDRKEHSFTERAQRERDETRFQAAEDEKAAWKREGAQ